MQNGKWQEKVNRDLWTFPCYKKPNSSRVSQGVMIAYSWSACRPRIMVWGISRWHQGSRRERFCCHTAPASATKRDEEAVFCTWRVGDGRNSWPAVVAAKCSHVVAGKGSLRSLRLAMAQASAPTVCRLLTRACLLRPGGPGLAYGNPPSRRPRGTELTPGTKTTGREPAHRAGQADSCSNGWVQLGQEVRGLGQEVRVLEQEVRYLGQKVRGLGK